MLVWGIVTMTKNKLLAKLRKINNFELKNFFFKDYVFDKKPFRIAMSLTFFLFVAVLSLYGFDLKDNFYYSCPEEFNLCVNQFYQDPHCQGDSAFCNTEFFQGGYTVGDPEPKVLKNFFLIPVVLFSIAFAYNHKENNRGVKQ